MSFLGAGAGPRFRNSRCDPSNPTSAGDWYPILAPRLATTPRQQSWKRVCWFGRQVKPSTSTWNCFHCWCTNFVGTGAPPRFLNTPPFRVRTWKRSSGGRSSYQRCVDTTCVTRHTFDHGDLCLKLRDFFRRSFGALQPPLLPTPIHVSVPRSEVERGKRTASEAGWSEEAHLKAWPSGPKHTEERSALDRIAAGKRLSDAKASPNHPVS